MQLEEELRLRKAEIQNLQARLRGAEAQRALESPLLPEACEQLGSANREQNKESTEHGEKYEVALATSRQEVESLKAAVDSKNQEISEMKQKIQLASKENVEMMDSWKVSALPLPRLHLHCPCWRLREMTPVTLGHIQFFSELLHQMNLFFPENLLPHQAKFDTLVSDHQRSMEELKVTLSSSPETGQAGQEPDVQELRATLEALKMEHQLEMENLKAKHKIEAALLSKEREDLSTRLQELKEQLTDANQTWRSEPEARSGKHALEEVSEKLQKAERRVAEVEQVEAELQQKLKLSEKMMADYEALQKAQRESHEEIQKLEEKLRVTANQLQAAQADRYTSQDANVRTDQSETSQLQWRRFL